MGKWAVGLNPVLLDPVHEEKKNQITAATSRVAARLGHPPRQADAERKARQMGLWGLVRDTVQAVLVSARTGVISSESGRGVIPPA